MNIRSIQHLYAIGLTVLAPWLIGGAGGCGQTQDAPPLSSVHDNSGADGGSGADASRPDGSTQVQAGFDGSVVSHADAGRASALDGGGCVPKHDGGSCEPPVSSTDGGGCVSDEGAHCGGNTTHPCGCATGLVCTPTPGSPAPGDVGGTCQRPKAGACTSSADCKLQADYCTGCDCVALGAGEAIDACSGPGVRCLVDPCASKSVQCTAGKCTVH